MRLVVIESPFAGDVEANTAYARRALANSLGKGEAPIASHLLYTQVLFDENPDERKIGIEAGLAWADGAELHAFYVDRGISKGMAAALKRAVGKRGTIVFRSLENRTGIIAVHDESGQHDVAIGQEWTAPDPVITLQDLLGLVSHHVPRKTIRAWSRQQRDQVSDWAQATCLVASDHDVDIPPKPACVKGYMQPTMIMTHDGPVTLGEGLATHAPQDLVTIGDPEQPNLSLSPVGVTPEELDAIAGLPLVDPSEDEVVCWYAMGSIETVCGIYNPAAQGREATLEQDQATCPGCRSRMR